MCADLNIHKQNRIDGWVSVRPLMAGTRGQPNTCYTSDTESIFMFCDEHKKFSLDLRQEGVGWELQGNVGWWATVCERKSPEDLNDGCMLLPTGGWS